MQEISISLEETNRLRESIGLPPIPQSEDQVDKPNNDNTKAEDNKSNVTSKQELSIDETNKLRISLGLQPLEVNKNSDAVENFNAHKQEAEKTKRDEQLRERLETAKLNSAKKRKLKGRTLLDDYEEMDNDDWLNNLDVKPAAPKTKTPKAGKSHNDSNSNHVDISVSHNINDLRLVKDNDVFTLKDSGINDDDPDEIFNQDLANKSKVKKHLEEMDKVRLIKNGIGYKSINDNDNDDNDINDINKAEKVSIKNSNISLDDKAVKPQSEFLSGPKSVDLNLFELDEISAPKKPLTKMKKIKSKKDKDKSKRKTFDENDDINLKSVKLENMDDDIADDADELEQALDLKRKLKQRSRTTMTEEDKAREIRNLTRSNAENDLETEAMKSTIVFDPTVDFINSLNTKPETDVKEQSNDLPTKIDNNETNSNTEVEKPIEESKHETQLTPQPKYGVGKLLKQLREDGLESSSDKTQRESVKNSELVKLKISIEERILKEQLNSDSQYMKLSEAEQEKLFQNKLDDILIEKEIVPNYENYNPKVNLTYRNDTGNELNTKQAFKFMSNKFHGTKSRDKKTKKEWLRKPKK